MPGYGRRYAAKLTSALLEGVKMIGKLFLACAVSFVIIVFGMPNIEQSRQEARNAQAFNLAQKIKSGSLPEDTVDPWGSKFDIQRPDKNELIVVSLGSNMVTPTNGYDSDDVSTSMSDPPHRQEMRRKQNQLLSVLVLAALPWVVLLVTAVRQRSHAQQYPAASPQTLR